MNLKGYIVQVNYKNYMDNDKIKLYLHIGQPKTGTSAIQAFLNYNREILLKKYRVLYPRYEPDYGEGLQHNQIEIFEKARNTSDYSACTQMLGSWVSYCSKNQLKSLVISNEAFFSWDKWPKILFELTEFLDVEVIVIVYLRRQDKWIESAWKQWGHKKGDFSSIQEFITKRRFNWNRRIGLWLDYFPKDHILLRPYEECQIGPDVVLDFLKLLNVNSQERFITPPATNENINTGFHRDIVEILRACRNLIVNEDDHTLIDFMFKVLPPLFKKRPMDDYGILSPQERQALLSEYENSNLRLAQNFFGPERTALFFEPVPDINEHWDPQNGLTIDKAIPVLLSIMLHQQKEIEKLQQIVGVGTPEN